MVYVDTEKEGVLFLYHAKHYKGLVHLKTLLNIMVNGHIYLHLTPCFVSVSVVAMILH